ncbi:hypothetical protein AB0M57_33665, partial [Streptomyces sp. NPDC051597]|uniref:hypothetical protein n=1 Tax=Streptomyces sp. NPDC051597 TaxID=3155049 RepID=UPI003437325B
TVTDPERHATKYEHDGDGAVTKVTDALNRSRGYAGSDREHQGPLGIRRARGTGCSRSRSSPWP